MDTTANLYTKNVSTKTLKNYKEEHIHTLSN